MPAERTRCRASLLIAAHGETRGAGDNWLAYAVAARVRKMDCFSDVSIGFIVGEPSIETGMRGLSGDRVFIYPLFMSDGYYVKCAIPKRLNLLRCGPQYPRDTHQRTGDMHQRTGDMHQRTGDMHQRTGDMSQRTGAVPQRTGTVLRDQGDVTEEGRRFIAVGCPKFEGEGPLGRHVPSVETAELKGGPLHFDDSLAAGDVPSCGVGQDHADIEVQFFRPLGLAPYLPTYLINSAIDSAVRAGVDPAQARLLLVAHGSSKSSASSEATFAVRQDIRAQELFASVEVAFLEEGPKLDDQLRKLLGPIILTGLFSGDGRHGGEDVPRAVAMSARRDIIVSQALARDPTFADLICDEIVREG